MVRMERLTLAVCISSSGAMVMLVLRDWTVEGSDARNVLIGPVCSAVVTKYYVGSRYLVRLD